jgi:hypothetical protein
MSRKGGAVPIVEAFKELGEGVRALGPEEEDVTFPGFPFIRFPEVCMRSRSPFSTFSFCLIATLESSLPVIFDHSSSMLSIMLNILRDYVLFLAEQEQFKKSVQSNNSL